VTLTRLPDCGRSRRYPLSHPVTSAAINARCRATVFQRLVFGRNSDHSRRLSFAGLVRLQCHSESANRQLVHRRRYAVTHFHRHECRNESGKMPALRHESSTSCLHWV